MTKAPIKISIITIAYNADKLIRKAIESVLEQKYEQLEYIIIDGGSTDKTVDIIKEYASELSYWISEKDDGISDAFNKGIAKASGELVGLLNADDYFFDEALHEINRNYDGSDIVYGNMKTILNGKDDGDYIPNHTKLDEDMTLCHPATFVRKDAYEKWGEFSLDFHLAMDYELLLRFKQAGATFQYINKTLSAMTMEGISNQQWKDAFKEVMLAQDLHLGSSMKRTVINRLRVQKKTVASMLNKTPLSSFVTAYRSKFSKVKKKR